jgi:hypothetical protein
MSDASSVHVVVPLVVEGGWPPAASESLLAHADGRGAYVLDQTPAFALDLSLGDTVAAASGTDGTLTFESRITTGGHRTFRLIALVGPELLDPVVDRLTALGARVTASGFPELWCIDLPPAVPEAAVRAALEEAAARGVLEFEDPRTP